MTLSDSQILETNLKHRLFLMERYWRKLYDAGKISCPVGNARWSNIIEKISQPAFTCSKSTIETSEIGVKFVQN